MHNLIANNTVGYAQDKMARTWTFHYYVDNARHRLKRILEKQSFEIVNQDYEVGRQFDAAQDWWTYHHETLDVAVDRLASYLLRKILPPE